MGRAFDGGVGHSVAGVGGVVRWEEAAPPGAGFELVAVVGRRQEALEKSLTLAREAEKKIAARAQVLEKVAESIASRAEKLKDTPVKGAKKSLRAPRGPVAGPKASLAGPQAETPLPGAPAPEPAEDAAAPNRERGYFLRPSLAAPAPGSRLQKVYEAADRGLNREQIARETGMLPGEVELILNLRPRKKG